MKKLILAALAITVVSGPASALDLKDLRLTIRNGTVIVGTGKGTVVTDGKKSGCIYVDRNKLCTPRKKRR